MTIYITENKFQKAKKNALIAITLKIVLCSFKKIIPAIVKKTIQIIVAGSGFFEKRGCNEVENLLMNFSLSWG